MREKRAGIEQLANRLAETSWQATVELEAIPYIGGTPAGVARQIDVLWKDTCLYVENRSAAKIAKAVALEIGRVFGRQEIIDAVKLCYDRSPEFVTEYLEENFTLRSAAVRAEDHIKTETGGNEQEGRSAMDNTSANALTTTQGSVETQAQPEPVQCEELEQNEPKVFEETDGEVSEDLSDLRLNETTDNIQEDVPGDDTDATTTRVKPRTKPTTTLMERFAGMNGYLKESSERFNHPDGSWIGHLSGSSFPWERHDATGGLLQYYWPKEHCLERGALELDWRSGKLVRSPLIYIRSY